MIEDINMLKEPPVVHAVSHWDEDARCARYQYNGRNVLTVSISGTAEVKYRLISDGNIQSDPFIQQVYLLVDGEAEATVRFEMTDDAVTMRPHRAEHEQAIVGQIGRPLIKGINGVYDRNEDLLISWFGRPWRWNDTVFTADESGRLVAEMTVKLSNKPWTVNFYPQYYRMHLGYRYHEPWKYRPNGNTPAGWCSWEAYRRDITEEHVRNAAEFCAEHFKPYGFDYIQIDDGFQCMPVPHDPQKTLAENWLETNERFPSGHEGVCRAIKEQGLKPGIWMSASVFNEQYPAMHESMFLKDEQGNVLDGKWIHYVLDCRAETLAETVKPLYNGLRIAGYEYVKTDQIRHLLYDGLHEMVRRGLMTNDEARDRFRQYMESAREGLGQDIYYLASWGVLPEVVGLVDACRIATDANPTWPKVRMQIVESGRWFHTQRILFINDPDHICARTRSEWAQTLLSLVSLSGGLFMLSDPIEAYDEHRVDMIKKCLPPLPTITAETGELDMHYSAFPWTKQHGFEYKGEVENTGFDIDEEEAYEIAGESRTIRNNHPHSSLWSFHFANGIGQWCVALRIATVPLKASILNIKDCALNTDREYLVFDFWAQRFLGIASETLEVPALKLGECQVLCFREVKSRPQFLACSRHVSMGAASVKSQEWKDNTLTVILTGVPGSTETYWFDCTPRWQHTAIEVEGAGIKQDHAPCGVLALDVIFNEPQARVAIQWKKRKTQHA
jgi:hypothetical protein